MKQVLIVIALVSLTTNIFAQNKFKKINERGEANFIFASEPIPKGKESTITLKNSFKKGDKIYTRGYFPKAIGTLKSGEQIFIEMWIDGKVAFKGKYGTINSSWDQISIYMVNTGDDDFSDIKKQLLNSGSGNHEVKLYFYKTEFKGYEKKYENGKYVNKKVYKAKYLTKGEFTYTN